MALLSLAALAAACATADPDDLGLEADADPASYADPSLDRFTWPELQTFESEAAFQRYLTSVHEEAERRGLYWWASLDGVAYAQIEADKLPCDPTLGECADVASDSSLGTLGEAQAITVTGSRITNPPITNVQEVAVDEGDIVKQIGSFLVVLQDGRLFSVDTRPGGESGLRLSGRADVYRSSEEDTWYDEMLVYGRRIVVTGYSYDENASEFTVLTLDDDGGFTREATFYMSSDDYYDSDNYATRLVGDRLVIHTPINLAGRDAYDPAVWPVIRRWRPEAEDGERAQDEGRVLFDARDIYKPALRTLQPTVHTVSVCPLGRAASGGDLACESTAIVGPEGYVFYVSEEDFWLWLGPGWEEVDSQSEDVDCKAGPGPGLDQSADAALYRIPLRGGEPSVIGMRGGPWDQFGMDATEREIRMLIMQWPLNPCLGEYRQGLQEHAYFRIPIRRLQSMLRDAPDYAYTPLPSPGGEKVENRFTDTHLVYASGAGWWGEPPYLDEKPRTARVIAVPLGSPADAVELTAPHDVIRLERAGDHTVMTGYHDGYGLSVSTLDLRGAPRLADTVVLPGRYESEGRSHAFNSLIEADGSGMIGVPTVLDRTKAERYYWWSEQSDVSFLTVDQEARLAPAGELFAHRDTEHKTYECEVSCVDWYGNARPIFTDGRIFALSGTEVIEGELVGSRIREARRINVTDPPPPVPPAPLASLPLEARSR